MKHALLVAATLAPLACERTTPFTVTDPEPRGPAEASLVRRLTVNPGPDESPAALAEVLVYATLSNESSLDVLLPRDFRLGGTRLGIYVDIRNLTKRRNIVAVRRDSGQPEPTEEAIQSMVKEAYEAHPEPIPYASARYRSWADKDQDGLIAGLAESAPLYERAARDFAQPLFFYAPPRLVRLGVEIAF